MTLTRWQIALLAALLLLLGPVLLLRLDIFPIAFGADYGFKEEECGAIEMSGAAHMLVCKRTVFGPDPRWGEPR